MKTQCRVRTSKIDPLTPTVGDSLETWAWAGGISNGRPSTTGGVGGQSVAGCKYRVRGQRGGSCFEDFCFDF